jgi:hypothetical protein
VPEGPQLVRSFVAVGAGFFAIQMLGWGADTAFLGSTPHPLDGKAMLLRLAYTAALEALGGYITARLAIRKPTTHAVILGIIVIAISLPLAVLTWQKTPAWYAIWALLLVLPMTILGSHVHELLAQRGTDGNK